VLGDALTETCCEDLTRLPQSAFGISKRTCHATAFPPRRFRLHCRKRLTHLKIILVITIAATANANAGPSLLVRAAEHKVIVCIEQAGEARYLPNAEMMASKMFATIGVKLDWHYLHSCPEPDAIQIGLSLGAPASEHPDALAYAAPYQSDEGLRIIVFYDRVRRSGGDTPGNIVLAHVLVHEITHILEGVAWHSESGVMKARWDSNDYMRMAWSSLPFSQGDIELIQAGLARRLALTSEEPAPH
jgi:hypothetical protein